MEEGIWRHDNTLPEENKTSTMVAPAAPPVTALEAPLCAARCGYVIAPGTTPFCDRPAVAGSSYCVWHRALCAVAPASSTFGALAAAQMAAADMPPELGRFDAPPEFFDESEDERLAGLDLPAPAIAGAE